MRKSILFVSLALAGLLARDVIAQELRGSVQGVVADASGGVIPGAQVILRNVGTGVQTRRETNSGGQYLFDLVSPGVYTITISQEGFRTFLQENVLVQTRSDLTVNANLEVGAVAETVKVTAAPVTVQFNKTTMETTLDTKMSTQLPIIHRNPFLLLTLDPQVIFTSTSNEQSPYHHWAGSRLDVGGGTELKNDILVDGVPNTWGPKTNYVPAMDAVSELNVQQNATDAEFGHSAGGIVSVQMKGGSNEFHGSVYFLGRNPLLNAVPDSTTHTPSLVRHNVWGASSGNPIVKNKVFNFVSYEGQNLREPVNIIKTLPTPLERRGDFSRSLNANGAPRQIYDPFTTQFDRANNSATRTPFPNNAIPASRIDPTSARFLKDIWEPNGAGDDITGVNNFRLTFPRLYHYYNFSDRTDWNINDKWRVFGRFSRFHTLVSSPNPTNSPAGSTGGSQRNSLTAAGDAVWALSPRTVINFRGSYNKPVDRFEDAVAEIKSLAEFFPQNPTWYDSYRKELPVMYYPGLSVGGSGFGRGSYWYSAPDFWNGQAKLSTQRGKHYLKIGGEYRHYRGNSSLPNPVNFNFPASHTSDTFINPNTRLSGDGWATFLLGVLNDDTRIRTVPFLLARNNYYGAYVQDDFKVSQRVTLNLGLRYEYDGPITDQRARFSRYLDLTNPIPEFQGPGKPALPAEVLAIRKTDPAYNGAWIFTDGSHPAPYNSPKFTLLPRAGVAFRLNNTTALRAGYSRYVVPPSVNIDGGINLNDVVPYPGYDQSSFPLPVLEGVPQARFSDPFPKGVNPLTPPLGQSLGRYTELGSTGQSIWFYQDLKNAYNDRFSFSVQRQTVSQIVVDVTYFVNVGSNQYYQRELNLRNPQYDYDFKAAINQRVANPFYNILTPEKFPGGLRNQATIAASELLKTYPQYGRLTQWHTPGVDRRYQSLQIKAQRPFTSGFNLLVGYNYHHARNMEFYDGLDQFNNALSWQDSNLARHKLNAAGIVNFPFGRDRKFMNHANAVADAILGGWTMSGIYTYVSGEFLRFGAVQVSGDPSIPSPSRDRMFDTSKFTRQPAFTRRTNPLQFPDVRGPRITNVDLTLAKEHKLTERASLEIRMESYNLLNTFMGANPNTNVDSSLFGRVTSERAAFYGRQIQYVARIRW